MPSLVAKKKGNQLYDYVVESARVAGKPRIVHQAYLGTAEKRAAMVRDRTAPVPVAASLREFVKIWRASWVRLVVYIVEQTFRGSQYHLAASLEQKASSVPFANHPTRREQRDVRLIG